MAFGDKLPETIPAPVLTWSKPAKVEITSGIDLAAEIPLPTVKRTAAEPVACCDDSYNFYVQPGTGVPFCLKCRKTMTIEHFNTKLNEYAERMKANR